MCPDVRVHVRLGSIRLDYEGDQSFYEAQVERLVDAASRRDGGPRPDAPASRALPGEARAAASEAPPPTGTAAPRADAAPAWTPKSSEFGRYVRRLGPDAAEADRQIVAFAFYLWNYERQETFGRTEIAGCFQALHLPLPEDLDALLADVTERKRFLERAGDATWRLSKKGENYVKTRLLAS